MKIIDLDKPLGFIEFRIVRGNLQPLKLYMKKTLQVLIIMIYIIWITNPGLFAASEKFELYYYISIF